MTRRKGRATVFLVVGAAAASAYALTTVFDPGPYAAGTGFAPSEAYALAPLSPEGTEPPGAAPAAAPQGSGQPTTGPVAGGTAQTAPAAAPLPSVSLPPPAPAAAPPARPRPRTLFSRRPESPRIPPPAAPVINPSQAGFARPSMTPAPYSPTTTLPQPPGSSTAYAPGLAASPRPAPSDEARRQAASRCAAPRAPSPPSQRRPTSDQDLERYAAGVQQFDAASRSYAVCLDGVMRDPGARADLRYAALDAANLEAVRLQSVWDSYDAAVARYLQQQAAVAAAPSTP